MTTRVLVPMDDSELAENALRYALETHGDAEITVMHVVGGPSSMFGEATTLALEDDIEAAAEEQASEVLDRARDIAAEYDRDIDTIIEMGRPARAIVERAETFDTVVVGSHGSSFADRLFVGDVAQTVFRRCPVPVTVVR
ncbi:universal stress protein [Natronomonas gomsonensis]|uniref:universal stress protein n=1 Tax=Natronomonas gomsonensis TaxID=1046043 RepID=UPI0015B8E855|nr:universal stress protein [Natronomonas gomsonensis]